MVDLVWINKTKAQKKEMLALFTQWYDKKDERFSAWLESIRSTTGHAFDLSKDSLNDLEVYIVNKFDDSKQLRLPEVEEEVNGICTYIGEVVLKELPLPASWGAPVHDWKGAAISASQFLWYIHYENSGNGYDPRGALPYIVKNKTSTRLYDTLQAMCKELESNK